MTDAAMGHLTFWGKARPVVDGGPNWHPVAFHLLDVAAALDAILESRPVTRARAARLFQMEEKAACALLVTLASLHDLGKFARPFQAKCPELWPAALGKLQAGSIPARTHTRDGWLLWDLYLRNRLGDDLWPLTSMVDAPLLRAVFGHHGKPLPDEDGRPEWVFGPGGLAAAESCARDLLALLGPVPQLPAEFNAAQSREASWWVAGLISLADWVGSNQLWFSYHAPPAGMAPQLVLTEYWRTAQRQARDAVAAAGLQQPQPAPRRTFQVLTGIVEPPTPMQRWAERAELPPGPLLIIIEDATGSGKTEAAQMLVHRLMVEGRANGAYWGMPTQATANAMYDRQAKAITRLFPENATPSLVLAHGQSALHLKLQSIALRKQAAELAASVGEDQLTATASCSAFLADDRRATLLADVGAGTVDQALLAILPSKFNTVRLMALADKILVLDEVHAYDEYVGIEASALLRFQAALGGSAVVLSATLPESHRRRLIDAWAAAVGERRRPAPGLWGETAPLPPLSHDYPLATIVSSAGCDEKPVKVARESRWWVPVRLIESPADAVAAIVSAQRQGAAVAWIRNTVDDCLAAAQLLGQAGVEPLIFHARFAQGDRQDREREVLGIFGIKKNARDRHGRVVVATQVIEQSLDLDFDLLVTDIAPMDLIIQRAGRLWRHPHRNSERPPALACELLVLSPVPVDEPAPDWLAGDFRGTAYVYRNPGVLWSTAQLLAQHRGILCPDGIRGLVEQAYDPNHVPPGLEAGSDKATATGYADASRARYATLNLDDGYHGGARTWESDTRVLTRLTDAYTTLRLARVEEGLRLRPWGEGPDERTSWALSEVKVRAWRAPIGSVPESRFAPALRVVLATWGEYEQEIPLLPLLPGPGGSWAGTLLRPDGKRAFFGYSREGGLTWAGRTPGSEASTPPDVTPQR